MFWRRSGFCFRVITTCANTPLKSAKVTSGDMAQKAFRGRSADVMGRYRHVTSAHPCQNRLQGLLPDVILAIRTAPSTRSGSTWTKTRVSGQDDNHREGPTNGGRFLLLRGHSLARRSKTGARRRAEMPAFAGMTGNFRRNDRQPSQE